VEAAEVHMMEQLDQYGFEVIPVDFFDVGSFGGGLHCATVDIFREANRRILTRTTVNKNKEKNYGI